MSDEPLPPEIVKALDQALNPTEAAQLLGLYRQRGVYAAVSNGLWLNKNRSAEGAAAWKAFNGPRQREKNQRKAANRRARRAKAEEILQLAIRCAKGNDGGNQQSV